MYKIHNPGWAKHCQMQNPLHDAGHFIHTCAEEPTTRVISATALVLALCQTAGPAMLSQPPGFLLINASGEPCDPIDGVMKNLTGLSRPAARPDAETFERHRKRMELMLLTWEKEQSKFRGTMPERGLDPNTFRHQSLIGNYHHSLKEAFGTGRAGWYADRYDELFGWVADETNHTILRVDREQDRMALRNDMRQRPQLFIEPQGCGSTMCLERKLLSIAGSLPVSEWDASLTVSIIENAIPVLFLPHTASEPLVTSGDLGLEWIGFGLANEAVVSKPLPIEPLHRLALMKQQWIAERIGRLRQRLQHFPPDYEFFILRTVRELLPCCQRLVTIMATDRSSREEQANLAWDLYTMTLQGISLGVEALGWHGYGFDSTCDRGQTLKVLTAIRDRGSISKRELLRNQQWLNAESRDAILTAFEKEGIVSLTDNEVMALPFTDYWRSVRHRAGRNIPAPFWKSAATQPAEATPA